MYVHEQNATFAHRQDVLFWPRVFSRVLGWYSMLSWRANALGGSTSTRMNIQGALLKEATRTKRKAGRGQTTLATWCNGQLANAKSSLVQGKPPGPTR